MTADAPCLFTSLGIHACGFCFVLNVSRRRGHVGYSAKCSIVCS